MNLYKLAQVKMNGRQIRNAITMGKYLAKFRKEILVYRYVRDAVDAIMKFENYLHDVRGSDEEWARQEKVR